MIYEDTMRKSLLAVLTLFTIISFHACNDKKENYAVGSYSGETTENGDGVWVEPYRRSDGTCVRGHWRSAPGRDCSLVGDVYKECP